MNDAAELIRQLSQKNKWALCIAELVSIASKIEPELMRQVRLELVDQADAGAEADLWFSPLVQSRNPSAIVLKRDVATLLRTELAKDSKRLDAAWEVVEKVHRHCSPALLVEEKLTWLALSGRIPEMKTLLRSVVATVLRPERANLLSWAASALPRLPASAREIEEAQMLELGVTLRLEEPEGFDVEGAQEHLPAWLAWITPQDVPVVPFGVRMLEGAVEFCQPDRPGAHRVNLPQTQPILIELKWRQGKRDCVKRVRLQRGQERIVETAPKIYSIYWQDDVRELTVDIRQRLAECCGEHNLVEAREDITDDAHESADLKDELETCDTVILWIGPDPSTETEERQSRAEVRGPVAVRSLSTSAREQIQRARKRDMEIIPVMLDNGEIPDRDGLSKELYTLTGLNPFYVGWPNVSNVNELLQRLHSDVQIRTVLGQQMVLKPSYGVDSPGQKLPIVRITYDTEMDSEEVQRELPFVVGVLADLSGREGQPDDSLSDREFLEIDRDNFGEVLARIAPHLSLYVDAHLPGDTGVRQSPVELSFNTLEDFEPINVVSQIPRLQRILDRRTAIEKLESLVDDQKTLSDLLEGLPLGAKELPIAKESIFVPETDIARLYEKLSMKSTSGKEFYAQQSFLKEDFRGDLQSDDLDLLSIIDVDPAQLGPLDRLEGLIDRMSAEDPVPLTRIAVSGQGGICLYGSDTGTLRLWDFETGKVLRTFAGHAGAINAIAIGVDDRTAVSGSADTTVKLWHVDSTDPLLILEGHGGEVLSLALSADETTCLSGSADGTLNLWDLKSGTLLNSFPGYDGKAIHSVAMSDYGFMALSGSANGVLQLWDLKAGKEINRIEGHHGAVFSVALSADGRHALSGGEDNTVKYWDLSTNGLLRTLEDHRGSVYAVALRWDDQSAVSGSADGTLKIWDLRTGAVLRTLEGHRGTVRSVTLLWSMSHLVSCSDDNTIKIWDPESGRLRRTVEVGRFRATAERQRALLDLLLYASKTPRQNLSDSLAVMLEDLDRWLSGRLRAVFHHPDFQKCEATWRGLHYLVTNTYPDELLKISVLDCSRDMLKADMLDSSPLGRSHLYRAVAEPFQRFQGEPFGVLIGDFEFSHASEDVEVLTRISRIAAAVHAPFISAAAPSIFQLEDFTHLSSSLDIGRVLSAPDYDPWHAFRASEESRYVALVLPHMLMRLPYGWETTPTEGFDFAEHEHVSEFSRCLWGNPAYGLGARLTNAFALYHWCAAIQGIEGGGLVEMLPIHTFRNADETLFNKASLDAEIDSGLEKELAHQGFIPLARSGGADYPAFFSSNTTHNAGVDDDGGFPAENRLSLQLPYRICLSRFAHYLKIIVAEKMGFSGYKQMEDYLNRWMARYVQTDSADDEAQAIKAEFPLSEGRIEIHGSKEAPDLYGFYETTGSLAADVFLNPRFQLETLPTAARIGLTLPSLAIDMPA